MLTLRTIEQMGMEQNIRHIHQHHRPTHLPSQIEHPGQLPPTTPPGVVTPTPTDSPMSMGGNKEGQFDITTPTSPISSSSSASTPSFSSCNSSLPSTPNVPTSQPLIPSQLRGKVNMDQGEDAFTRVSQIYFFSHKMLKYYILYCIYCNLFFSFLKELQRQKAEYEAKKRNAENLRKEEEQTREKEQQVQKEQNRRMAQHIQKEQQMIMDRERLKVQQRYVEVMRCIIEVL